MSGHPASFQSFFAKCSAVAGNSRIKMGWQAAQSPRIRHRVPQRRCTTYRNDGQLPARIPAPLSTRRLRERRSCRYANLVSLHRFWSWFRGALCKICGVFQRARRILSPLRLPVPPRPPVDFHSFKCLPIKALRFPSRPHDLFTPCPNGPLAVSPGRSGRRLLILQSYWNVCVSPSRAARPVVPLAKLAPSPKLIWRPFRFSSAMPRIVCG